MWRIKTVKKAIMKISELPEEIELRLLNILTK
jgi:hypothetical protein